jgi:hypothetical protein
LFVPIKQGARYTASACHDGRNQEIL